MVKLRRAERYGTTRPTRPGDCLMEKYSGVSAGSSAGGLSGEVYQTRALSTCEVNAQARVLSRMGRRLQAPRRGKSTAPAGLHKIWLSIALDKITACGATLTALVVTSLCFWLAQHNCEDRARGQGDPQTFEPSTIRQTGWMHCGHKSLYHGILLKFLVLNQLKMVM